MADYIKQELNKCVEYISSIEGVLKIYLFGSHAYGKPHENSDLDLMIIVKDHLDPIKTAFSINKRLFKTKKISTDIAVNRETDFEKASKESLFQQHIAEKGVVLYVSTKE